MDRVADRRAGFRIALHEGRREAAEHPDEIMKDEHLAVAVRAGADTNGRNRDAPGDHSCERRRHELEHDAPAARRCERLRAFEDAARILLILALQLVADESGRRLRREANVPEHRYARAYEAFDERRDLGAAFELHRVRAR